MVLLWVCSGPSLPILNEHFQPHPCSRLDQMRVVRYLLLHGCLSCGHPPSSSIMSSAGARAGIYSMDWKKEGGRTHPQQHNPARPILQVILTDHRKPTGSRYSTMPKWRQWHPITQPSVGAKFYMYGFLGPRSLLLYNFNTGPSKLVSAIP